MCKIGLELDPTETVTEYERASNAKFVAFPQSLGTASCILIKHVNIVCIHRPKFRNVKAIDTEQAQNNNVWKLASTTMLTSDRPLCVNLRHKIDHRLGGSLIVFARAR